MSDAQVHKVRFEPVGVEMEVEEGETVLDAAFRQGISLMHGCKEGQCGSCKSKLIDGDIELLKYSTFALPDYESETESRPVVPHPCLQRCQLRIAQLRRRPAQPLDRSEGVSRRVANISALTSDIRLLEIEIDKPLKFWAGQYVDLTLGGWRRSPGRFQWRTRPAKAQSCALSSRNIPMGRSRPDSMAG